MPNDEPRRGLVPESTAAFMATLAATGSFREALAAGSVPSIAVLAQLSLNEIGGLRRSSTETLIEETAANLHQEPGEVAARALDSEEGRELFAAALQAAAETLNRRKVRALAKALANGLRDDGAAVDESRLILQAISDLEEPHIKVLERAATISGNDSFTMRHVTDRFVPGLSNGSAGSVVATLERQALIVTSERERQRAEAVTRRRAVEYEQAQRDQAERMRAVGAESFQSPMPLPEARVIRPEPAWVITGFGRVCWQYLTREADPANGANE